MPLAEIRKETERRMVVSIDALKAELKHLRTGRASVALLEGVHGRVLRHADAAQPGREPLDARRHAHPDPALGGAALPRHREGDPRRATSA